MGSFASLCLLSHCVSATEINRTHSIPSTFNHVSLSFPVPHQPPTTDSLQSRVKVTRPLQANALWAECPRAKQSRPVRGAVMTGCWCLCSKFAGLALCSNFSCQTILTHWSHSERTESLIRSYSVATDDVYKTTMYSYISYNWSKSNKMAPWRYFSSIYGQQESNDLTAGTVVVNNEIILWVTRPNQWQ